MTRMANDPTLAAEVNSLVMPTGMSVQAAAAMGFRNLNQFLTALNAAKDLGLDFKQLQMDMTGPGHDSLAQAILAKEVTKEAAEEATEAAKTPTSGGTTGSTTAGSQTRP